MNKFSFIEREAWYVLQTKPKQEFRALEQLENQGYKCFLPTVPVERTRRGKLETCIEPLFARYIFIQLNTIASNWAPIRSTRGVSKFIAFGDRIAVLPDDCIAALQNAPISVYERMFEKGERVVVKSGPFAGLEGIYQMADGEARAMVLIELISQPQKLTFAIETLRKAA